MTHGRCRIMVSRHQPRQDVKKEKKMYILTTDKYVISLTKSRMAHLHQIEIKSCLDRTETTALMDNCCYETIVIHFFVL